MGRPYHLPKSGSRYPNWSMGCYLQNSDAPKCRAAVVEQMTRAPRSRLLDDKADATANQIIDDRESPLSITAFDRDAPASPLVRTLIIAS
jgi:hypothetical protein